MRPRVVAIVPAAGLGKRLKTREKKAFVRLGGRPLIVYALKTLNSSKYIDTIIIAVQPTLIKRLKGIIKKYGISKAKFITGGGKTRSKSVKNCFDLIGPSYDIVLVHDAARPFLSEDMIAGSVLLAQRHGACITAVRQTDTVKLADKNLFIRKTLDRDSLWRAQTPQVFKYSLLKKAYSKAGTREEITDDAIYLERIGKKVKILEGSAKNIKVTTKEDLKMAEVLL
ncbi:MAG: 2-C-methyl-D-erythritol 4-phosphate cytidylyltransferase [Candidatus Omnitrophota bacterium]|nr:2-C-methyl-D-erythritol 4-phosphate cytidylyltransferase [Candidatus Omnitrophota bacterium]